MIFNFGAQRSGTLWLQRIVTAHPAVAAVPSETELFSMGIAPLLERFHHGLRSSTTVGQTYVEREVLLDATRDFVDSVFIGHLTEGAQYLAERTAHHVTSVDVISAVYPDARLVHIIRDGRDVARSLVARDWGPATVAEAAERWRSAVVAARSAAPAEGYREVRYEDILDDPAETIAGLYDWLGLEHDEAILAEALAEARVRRNQDAKDPTPRHDKWRDHFSAEDVRAFEEVAGGLLDELGYKRQGAAPPAAPAPARGGGPASAASAPAGTRLRGRLAGLAGRARGHDQKPADAPAVTADGSVTEVGGPLAGSQAVVDQLLSAIHSGRMEDVLGLVDPDAAIRVVGPEGETVGRGTEVLTAALRDDPAWRGRQVRGDMHPGIPTYSVVLSYVLENGERADRVLELAIRKRLARTITIYKPPLS